MRCCDDSRFGSGHIGDAVDGDLGGALAERVAGELGAAVGAGPVERHLGERARLAGRGGAPDAIAEHLERLLEPADLGAGGQRRLRRAAGGVRLADDDELAARLGDADVEGAARDVLGGELPQVDLGQQDRPGRLDAERDEREDREAHVEPALLLVAAGQDAEFAWLDDFHGSLVGARGVT
jgi:hypothetical protein